MQSDNGEVADFGRSALNEAVVLASQSPSDSLAYAAFSLKVESLRAGFNRETTRDAELRLSVLALGPLYAGLSLPAEEQMRRYATTVWPTILKFPVKAEESAESYVKRLCEQRFALSCQSLVPEFWAEMLNAQVWRKLKSRILVAYDHCRWCDEDGSFAEVLSKVEEGSLQVELAAQAVLKHGVPSAWPKAGAHAQPFASKQILSFGEEGLVTFEGGLIAGGDWRSAIATGNKEASMGVHMRPGRVVGELLNVLRDVRKAGYSRVDLVARGAHFPYDLKSYGIESKRNSFQDLGVHRNDTLQVLVQALDLRDSAAEK